MLKKAVKARARVRTGIDQGMDAPVIRNGQNLGVLGHYMQKLGFLRVIDRKARTT